MARVAFNDDELNALWGLPWLAQLVYFRVIRPNMDYGSGVVGMRSRRTKRISYQAVREAVEVHPARGRKVFTPPSIEEIRTSVRVLVRAGLISPLPGDDGADRFVFKCELADTDYSVQNKDNSTATQITTEIKQDKQHSLSDGKSPVNDSENSGLDEFSDNDSIQFTTDLTRDSQHVSLAIHNTPPEPDLKNNTTHAPARKSGLIPDNFCLDAVALLRLQTGGVCVSVAEYFLDEFKAEAESRGSVSFNWPAELVKYCKRWEWRYDKEQPNAAGVSGNKQSSSNRASRVHESLKAEYASAIAEEQGDSVVQPVSGAVRSQVVIPYRKR